jgi:hypothetical protein
MRLVRIRISAVSATSLRISAEALASISVFRELTHSHSRNELSRGITSHFGERGRRKSSPGLAGGDGGGEVAKERERVVPAEAGVGDALSVDELLRRGERLGTGDEIAF